VYGEHHTHTHTHIHTHTHTPIWTRKLPWKFPLLTLVINMTQHKHAHHLSERAPAVTWLHTYHILWCINILYIYNIQTRTPPIRERAQSRDFILTTYYDVYIYFIYKIYKHVHHLSERARTVTWLHTYHILWCINVVTIKHWHHERCAQTRAKLIRHLSPLTDSLLRLLLLMCSLTWWPW